LQDKLNLTESNLLLEDTLLLNHYSIDFASYIWNARNTFLMRTVKWTDNYELFIKNINEVLQQTSTFGLKAKQYVFFYWLMFDMKIKGTNLFLDTTANALKRDNWISKKYHDVFLKERQTYEHLFHGKPAPHLQGINTEEKVVSLNDLKGKVVFVDVWATWCAPCIEALPHVQELQEKFKNNKDVIFLFLSNDSREDGDKQWKNYLKEHPEFKGIHVRAREKEDRKFEGGWKVTGIPRYLLIDKQGNIIDAFARNNSYEKLAEMIEEASRK
jgi:thiol-disulfide isomerase/thioredoxin